MTNNIASDDNLASFEGKYPKDLFNKSRMPIPGTKKRKKATTTTNTTTAAVPSSKSENYRDIEKNQQTSAIKLTPKMAEIYPKEKQTEKESSSFINETRSKMPVDAQTTAASDKKTIEIADKKQPITIQEDNISSSTALPTTSSQPTTTRVTEATLQLRKPERMVIKEAEEIGVEKAVIKTETSSVLEDDVKLDQSQQRGDQGMKETLSNDRKQETIKTEVIEKSPGNVEFNPSISSVDVSAAIRRSGLPDHIDDIGKSKEEEKKLQEQHHVSDNDKKEENYKLSHDETSQFTSSIALWEYSMMKWLDIYSEFATNTVKTAEYWFTLFWNPWTGRTVGYAERKNTERLRVE